MGSVAAGETKVVATFDFEGAREISFENRGTVGLDFDISTDRSTLEGNIVDLDGGARLTYAMNWLNASIADGTSVNLLVRNNSADAGMYWVSLANA